jgi:hypothetical protein
MIWPTLCVDNFFKDPKAVIEFSKTLDFIKNDGRYPGYRTKPVHTVNPDFFQLSTAKIMASLYPNEALTGSLKWTATQYFQKIKTNENKELGYVHQDLEFEFTSIVYLSDEEDAGTAIFKKIKEPIPSHNNVKIKKYLNNKKSKEYFDSIKKNRECFQQTLEFTSLKNRMVLFDASQFHAVNNFGKEQKERLTLITFFNSVSRDDGSALKFHVNECLKM